MSVAYLPALILAAWAIATAAGARDDGAVIVVLLAVGVTVLMQISQSIRRHFGGDQ